MDLSFLVEYFHGSYMVGAIYYFFKGAYLFIMMHLGDVFTQNCPFLPRSFLFTFLLLCVFIFIYLTPNGHILDEFIFIYLTPNGHILDDE
jgi:hypothetical protein